MTTTTTVSINLNALVVPAQSCMLHNPHAAPTQSLPPFAGAGLLQVLLWVPPLQAVEQALNRDHPPSTSTSHMSKSNDQPSLQLSLANAMQNTIVIKCILQPGPSIRTTPTYLDSLACCTPSSLRLHNPCRHSHAQDCCTFWSQFHLHNFSSTPRNRTILRLVCCRQ